MELPLNKYLEELNKANLITYSGKVSKIIGLTIESIGPAVELGEICSIYPLKNKDPIDAEVVGFKDEIVLLMPLGEIGGIGPGSKVVARGHYLQIDVGEEMLGRVLSGLGNPIDGGPKPFTASKYDAYNSPPNPLLRKKIREVLPLGIKAIDSMITCGKGQRIGIFAGSGVGKSTLMGMMARNTTADINVIALIGERGREVREFIESDLGEEGLRRSVVIVATSDQPALVRVKGALLATAAAEYFRDQGKDVLLMMDSLTRFSMAQREVGLAIGEPPVSRGYPPSVFAELPKLLERAGTSDDGSITGLYTVLVDGDDFNEPITDAVRGILDGHILLSRKLADVGYYPAINIIGSVSRVMPLLVSEDHMQVSRNIKELVSTFRDAEDLINIGAYKQGTNPAIDLAIEKQGEINSFLTQGMHDRHTFEEITNAMLQILD